jgi:squalene-hopene/tetraprenyl-beta-curcumene cyclase
MNITFGGNQNSVMRQAMGKNATVLTDVEAQSAQMGPGLIRNVHEAAERTQSYYLEQQHSDGYWWYELESNVTINAEYLMLLHFLGLKDEERDKKLARHILRRQRADGTWAKHWGGEGDVSTTVEAYFALKIAGYRADDEHMVRARDFILAKGGLEKSRVFTKIFLALFGEVDWKAVPSIPPEITLLPSWAPLNIYSFSSWARSTIVPLSVIVEHKPIMSLPPHMGVRELYMDPGKVPPMTSGNIPPFSLKKMFLALDRVIKMTEGSSVRFLKERAVKNIERWILEHQEPTGDWGGIQPAMVNSLLALVSMGYDLSSECIEKGLEALERFTIEGDEEIVLQSCVSPVWDTALTALALLGSAVDRDHPSLLNACRWLASKQIFRNGDWSVKRPGLVAGGWAFEFENSWYPDVDDTAVVLLLLNRYLDKEFINAENMRKGLTWIFGMQGRDGGWGAFDVDNDAKILNHLPFGDLEAMIDPSTPDLTGRVLELLGLLGYGLSDKRVKRAIRFIRKTQEKDGTWWGRWGVNYIYGTSLVLGGLGAVGEDMESPYVRRAVAWLKNIQNSDGGWGECCESYEDSSLKCRGVSAPSQTAWAILGLLAAGEEYSAEVIRGIQYLLNRQLPDGTWEEESFTGTGFPRHFMIRYHNYRNCFPLMALGRFLSKVMKGERRGETAMKRSIEWFQGSGFMHSRKGR